MRTIDNSIIRVFLTLHKTPAPTRLYTIALITLHLITDDERPLAGRASEIYVGDCARPGAGQRYRRWTDKTATAWADRQRLQIASMTVVFYDWCEHLSDCVNSEAISLILPLPRSVTTFDDEVQYIWVRETSQLGRRSIHRD